MAHCNSYHVNDTTESEPELTPELPEGAEEDLDIEDDEDAVEDLEVDDVEDLNDEDTDLEDALAEDDADAAQDEVEPKSIVQ